MTEILNVIAWVLVVMGPLNVLFLWLGWRLHRSVNPRSPILRVLLWVDFSIWLLSAYFSIVAFRYLYDIEPVMPFGGIGLGVAIIFVLSLPVVIYLQIRAFLNGPPP
jgi:hypothetical protein